MAIKLATENMLAKTPVWMAPRISRFRTVSVLRKPVREREKTITNVAGDRKSVPSRCRLKQTSLLVMNVSTTTCMDNQAMESGRIRGISDKLNDWNRFDVVSQP